MSAQDQYTAEEIEILKKLDDDFNTGSALSASPARDRMRKYGLIYSGPRNPPGRRQTAGKGARWYLTEAGRTAAEKYRNPFIPTNWKKS